MINDMRTVAKIEPGRRISAIRWTRAGCSTSRLKLINHQGGEKDRLSLKVERWRPNCGPTNGPRQTDLINLVSSAVKVTPLGGASMCGRPLPKNGDFQIMVRDNGPGNSARTDGPCLQAFSRWETLDRQGGGTESWFGAGARPGRKRWWRRRMESEFGKGARSSDLAGSSSRRVRGLKHTPKPKKKARPKRAFLFRETERNSDE